MSSSSGATLSPGGGNSGGAMTSPRQKAEQRKGWLRVATKAASLFGGLKAELAYVRIVGNVVLVLKVRATAAQRLPLLPSTFSCSLFTTPLSFAPFRSPGLDMLAIPSR